MPSFPGLNKCRYSSVVTAASKSTVPAEPGNTESALSAAGEPDHPGEQQDSGDDRRCPAEASPRRPPGRVLCGSQYLQQELVNANYIASLFLPREGKGKEKTKQNLVHAGPRVPPAPSSRRLQLLRTCTRLWLHVSSVAPHNGVCN